MSARAWPSRGEWHANAALAVRTFCTKYERLEKAQPGTVWASLAEEREFEDLAGPAAKLIRALLTPEIARLRALVPDRPSGSRARVSWFVALEGQAYEDACNLGALEEMRREVERARRERRWGTVAWELGRLRKSYPAVTLPAGLVAMHDRLKELQDLAEARRDAAADAIELASVDREVERRRTDEAWASELDRRAEIESPRVVRVGQTSPVKGDQMT